MGFKVRGCRKNVNIKHSWFFYSDEKPKSKEITDSLKLASNFPVESTIQNWTRETTKHTVTLLPSFSLSWDIGKVVSKWLTGSGGGYKNDCAAQQSFWDFVVKTRKSWLFDVVDLSLCSPNFLFKFIDYLQDKCKLGHGERLDYIDAISEVINFRKLHGASEAVF